MKFKVLNLFDKTEIEFKNEVTAIVGPNGSGKSNISDAIRWVLGEQSIKTLGVIKWRILYSPELIKKALGYAEVTLTLDNSDQALPMTIGKLLYVKNV